MVMARPRFLVCRRREAPDLPLAGKFNTMRELCAVLAFARVTAHCARDLSMESWLVTLSTAKGEALFGREP